MPDEEPEKFNVSLFESVTIIVKSEGDLFPLLSFTTFLITVRTAKLFSQSPTPSP